MSRPSPAEPSIPPDSPVVEASPNAAISSAPLIDIMNDEGIDLPSVVWGAYSADSLFWDILEHPKQYQNFKEEDGLLFMNTQDCHLLCIPKTFVKRRSIHEIVISEAHSLLAHLEATKTLAYLRDNVWWKEMVAETISFCESCMTCKRSKPSNQKLYGLLNLLDIPGKPWEAIGIDFVGLLPESSNRDGTCDSDH